MCITFIPFLVQSVECRFWMRINCRLSCLQMWIILKSGFYLCITFRLYTQPAGFIPSPNGTVRRDKQSNRFSCFRRSFVFFSPIKVGGFAFEVQLSITEKGQYAVAYGLSCKKDCHELHTTDPRRTIPYPIPVPPLHRHRNRQTA